MAAYRIKLLSRNTNKAGVSALAGLVAIFLLLSASFKTAPIKTSQDYQVKAVFLFNLTQFVEWPAEAFEKTDSPLVIGVFGRDPFGEYLDETVKGENVNGHPLIVARFNTVDEIGKCHILFISEPDNDKLPKIFKKLNTRNILTVGDATNFAKAGGTVRLLTENRKTRIQINLEAAREAGLTISSKLLSVADTVEMKNN